MQSSETIFSDSRQQKARLWQAVLITMAIALILIGVVWIWKSVEIKSINKKAENYRQLVKEQASRQVMRVQEEQLRSLAKPLVWSLRTEMLKGNLDKVDLYIEDLVQEKNVKSIIVTNNKGKIVASTDKKKVGKPYSSIGNGTALESSETTVKQLDDSTMLMTSPIMGFNTRLGVVFLQYTSQPLAL